MAKYLNITGEITQALLTAGNNSKASLISLANVHATTKCTVDLYVEKQLTGKFYLLKAVELPVGVTLLHDILVFNNYSGEYGLYIKLTKSASETPAVDVILS